MLMNERKGWNATVDYCSIRFNENKYPFSIISKINIKSVFQTSAQSVRKRKRRHKFQKWKTQAGKHVCTSET